MTGVIAAIEALSQTPPGSSGGTGFPSGIPVPNYAFDFTATVPNSLALSRASNGVFQTRDGLYNTATNNQARVDWGINPFGLPYVRGLLIEGASSFLLTRTDQPQVSPPWQLVNASITGNSQPGPFGSTTMARLTNSAQSQNWDVQPISSVTQGSVYVFTAHIKAGATDPYALVEFTELGSGWATGIINMGNGTVAGTTSSNWSLINVMVEPMADGTIWRVTVMAMPNSTRATNVGMYITTTAGQTVSTPGATAYLGDLQVEQATKATTYLPASADTPVTRAAETATLGLVATPQSLTPNSNLATFVSQNPHGFPNGASVVIAGATPVGYNGTYTITVVNLTTFTYTMAGAQTLPATGTITAALASQAYDVLIKDPDGVELRSATVVNGLYPLTPRAGRRHISKVFAWNSGVLTATQKAQITSPVVSSTGIGFPPLPGYTLRKEYTFGTGKFSNGANSVVVATPAQLLQSWQDHLPGGASNDTRTYNFSAGSFNTGIYNNVGVILPSFWQNIIDIGNFGYFEMRAKMPPNGGTWPIFTLYANATDFAAGSNGGDQSQSEIRLVEMHPDGTAALFKNNIVSTFHSPNHTVVNTFTETAAASLAAGFHVYGLEWTVANEVQFYFDGQPVGPRFIYNWSDANTPNAPAAFRIEVQDLAGFNGVAASGFTTSGNSSMMSIDYIRWWQLASASSSTTGAGAVGSGDDKTQFGWTQTFSDHFNGVLDSDGTLYFDRSKWTSGLPNVALGQDSGGNGSRYLSFRKEQQLYVDKDWAGQTGQVATAQRINPFSFTSSHLQIRTGVIPSALQAAYGAGGAQVFYSGSLTTCNKFAQLFGMFEIRMQTSGSYGAVPQLFLLPQPASATDPFWPPAVHVMELMPFLRPTQSSWHYYQDRGTAFQGWASMPGSVRTDGAMHIYTLIWDATNLTWFVDGVQFSQQPTPALMKTQPMFMTLAVPIGGEWYRLEAGNAVGNYQQLVTDVTNTPSLMPYNTQVDFVRVYALINAPVSPIVPGFYVSTSGSDSNAGTLAAPFLTLEKAQQAMQGSSTIKTTYVRAGTYNRAGTFNLSSGDSGTTWSYYPPDGVNTAVLDGGNTVDLINIDATGTNISFIGIKMQHVFDYAFSSNGDHTTLQYCDIGFNQATLFAGGFPPMVSISATNAKILNNYVHDTSSQGIAQYAFDPGTTIDGSVISGNVVLRAAQQVNDGGAIYINMRNTNVNGGRVSIVNNYVKDYGAPGVQGEGIYLDDDASNCTISGNVIGPTNSSAVPSIWQAAAFMNGGCANDWSNNIFDLGAGSNEYIIDFPNSGDGSGGTIAYTPTTRNLFHNNIIISNYAGATTTNNLGAPGVGYAIFGTFFSIQNNLYHNYGGGDETNIATSDSSPVHGNPQISGYTYTVAGGSPAFNAPVGFHPIIGNWGPPGFVIPQTGKVPSCPLAPPPVLPAKVFGIYFWTFGGPTVASIQATYPKLNVLYAFVAQGSGTTPTLGNPYTGFAADIAAWKAAGKVALLSVGGAGIGYNWSSNANMDAWITNALALCNTYGLQGIDIDVEAANAPTASQLTYIGNQLKSRAGANFIVTFVPQPGGNNMFNGPGSPYYDAAISLGSNVDLIAPQYYDQGTTDSVYANEIVTTDNLAGIPASKLMIGCAAISGDTGGRPTTAQYTTSYSAELARIGIRGVFIYNSGVGTSNLNDIYNAFAPLF